MDYRRENRCNWSDYCLRLFVQMLRTNRTSEFAARVGGPARRRRGATMIELLVVIALISLLISILIPGLRGSMKLASATLCKHHLREIGLGLMMYRIDNNGWLPVADPSDGSGQAEGASDAWFEKLFPTYLNDPNIMTCPEDPHRYRMSKLTSVDDDPNVGDYASYGINGFPMKGLGGGLAHVDRLRPRRPSNTILVADLGPDREIATTRSEVETVVGPVRNASVLSWDDGYDPFALFSAPRPWLTTRHGEGIHMLTLTGGVRAARTRQIMREPLRRFYSDCSNGGCTMCNQLHLPHYSFAKDQLFWWTGSTAATGVTAFTGP